MANPLETVGEWKDEIDVSTTSRSGGVSPYGWAELEITFPDWSPLEDFVSLLDKLKDLVSTIADALDVLANFLIGQIDALATLIQSLIDALTDIVESFLDDLGGYALYVPIRKRLATNFLGLGDITPSWGGGNPTSIFAEPTIEFNPHADKNPSKANKSYVEANKYNGGNMGFWKTVEESIQDKGDRNRPQFQDEDDYVGGMIMLTGTALDPMSLLDSIWRLLGMFGNLFKFRGITEIPKPSGLRAYALTQPKDDGGKFSVRLEWDPLDVPISQVTDLGNAIFVPEEVAIIRVKNDVQAMAYQNVVQAVGTRDLTEGLELGSAKVVSVDKYDPTTVTYLDKDIDAGLDDSFYYMVAWKLKAYKSQFAKESDVDSQALGYWDLSNVARVTPFPNLPESIRPDWVRTPSLAEMLPGLGYFVRKVLAQIQNFSAKLLAAGDLAEQYVQLLKDEVAKYEALANSILSELQKLNVLFNLPTTGIYTRTFEGVGGNAFFLNDLRASLCAHPDDPNAPPFTRGDEFVTGVVLLAGGNKTAVKGFTDLLGLIFGGSTSEKTAKALESVLEAAEELENTNFDDVFEVTETQQAETVSQSDQDSLDEQLQCNSPEETQETFADDFTVVY